MNSPLLITMITFIAFLLVTICAFLKYRLNKTIISSPLFLCFAFLSFSGLALVNLLEKLNTYLNNITHIKGLFLLTGVIFLFSAIYSYKKEVKLYKKEFFFDGGGEEVKKTSTENKEKKALDFF